MAKSAFASWLPANVSYEFVFRSADLSPGEFLASAQESPKETCLAHLNIFMLLYTDGLMGMRRDFLDRCYVDADVGVKEPGSLVMNIAMDEITPKLVLWCVMMNYALGYCLSLLKHRNINLRHLLVCILSRLTLEIMVE